MADEVEQLRWAANPRAARRAGGAVGLGDALNEFMTSKVSPRQGRFKLITEAWARILPAELRRHCRIVDVSGSRLKVSVDSPSYVYKLQLSSSELLEELQRRCPGARIEEIKFAIG